MSRREIFLIATVLLFSGALGAQQGTASSPAAQPQLTPHFIQHAGVPTGTLSAKPPFRVSITNRDAKP